MKRFLLMISAMVGLVIILTGCMPKDGKPVTREQMIRTIEKQGITEIAVYKSEAHGKVGTTLIKKLTTGEEHLAVVQALKKAEEIPGMLDTVTPDYDFVFHLKNKDRLAFHFWLKLGEEKGMFTSVSNTGIGYTISKETAQALLSILK